MEDNCGWCSWIWMMKEWNCGYEKRMKCLELIGLVMLVIYIDLKVMKRGWMVDNSYVYPLMLCVCYVYVGIIVWVVLRSTNCVGIRLVTIWMAGKYGIVPVSMNFYSSISCSVYIWIENRFILDQRALTYSTLYVNKHLKWGLTCSIPLMHFIGTAGGSGNSTQISHALIIVCVINCI